MKNGRHLVLPVTVSEPNPNRPQTDLQQTDTTRTPNLHQKNKANLKPTPHRIQKPVNSRQRIDPNCSHRPPCTKVHHAPTQQYAPRLQGTNAPMHQCTKAPMHQCTNAPIHSPTIKACHKSNGRVTKKDMGHDQAELALTKTGSRGLSFKTKMAIVLPKTVFDKDIPTYKVYGNCKIAKPKWTPARI